MFERIFTFVNYSLFTFILIMSMDNLGKIIGLEQMEDLGIAIIFGAVYLQLMIMDKKKKDKEEEKDGVD